MMTRIVVLDGVVSKTSKSSLVALSFVFSGRESSAMGRLSSLSSFTETRHSVSSSAALPSNSGVFLALIAPLRSWTVSVTVISTENALDVASPSTRQNRFMRSSVMEL